jgi:hypothetical protein
MSTRGHRRYRGIIPLKMTLDEGGRQISCLAHTRDISPSGCRAITTRSLRIGTEIRIEYRHRRVSFRVVWCRPVPDRKYEFETGLKMLKPEPLFWGEALPHGQDDPRAALLRGEGVREEPAWNTEMDDIEGGRGPA